MKKYKQYKFKKIYLEDEIFTNSNSEVKIGYLNINDLTADFHAEYINADKNLVNVDILVLADTRLNSECNEVGLMEKLNMRQLSFTLDSVHLLELQ